MLQAISLESQLVQNANGKSGMMVRVRTEEAAVCATRYKEVDRDVMQVSMEQNYEKANLGHSKHKRMQLIKIWQQKTMSWQKYSKFHLHSKFWLQMPWQLKTWWTKLYSGYLMKQRRRFQSWMKQRIHLGLQFNILRETRLGRAALAS